MPVEAVRLNPENPRRISEARSQEMMVTMEKERDFARVRPVLVNADGQVVGGNHRLLAARALGWATVPVLVVDVSPERAKLWALLDNAAFAEWDEPLLAELLGQLQADGVELALSGFSSSDLDRILAGLPTSQDPDDVPAIPEGESDSQPGTTYLLGRHLVRCGDARDRDAIVELAGGETVDLVITDPPYGVGYQGKTAAALRIENDNPEGLRSLLGEAFTAADLVLSPGGRFYVFCLPDHWASCSEMRLPRLVGDCTSPCAG
jgi:hypothetical protein